MDHFAMAWDEIWDIEKDKIQESMMTLHSTT